MSVQYMVKAFVPKVAGCGAQDAGWDDKRCNQFENFVNTHAIGGWRLHSSEYRKVAVKGCGGANGAWLVCIFEKQDASNNATTKADVQVSQTPAFCTGCGTSLESGLTVCGSCGKKVV